jgi:glycosyltransferase involved in cell wall biosynthesis
VATTIAGDGDGEDFADALRRLVERHGVGVRLPGVMSQAALFEEYGRASVFCLPCRVLDNGDRDGIPNVIVEAMAAGLPVVTTPVSGIPEIVEDGVNGLLVEPDDAERLADALLRLYADPGAAGSSGGCRREHRPRPLRRERPRRTMAGLFREALA